MNKVKQILKDILPAPILRAVRYGRDVIDLMPVPANETQADHLCPEHKFYSAASLSDSVAAQGWAEDHARIAAAYGSEDIMGGVNPGDRRALYTLVRTLKPARILEVGTHIGASTLYLAAAQKAARPEGVVTTVDILDVNGPSGPWKDLNLKQPPRDYAAGLGLKDKITFVTGSSLDFMAKTDQRFDFIFLDGGHQSSLVYQEVPLALRVLAPGGLIVLHDYYPEAKPLFPDGNLISGPYLALRRLQRENASIKVLSLSPLPWPTKQGSQATSLAVLLKKVGAA